MYKLYYTYCTYFEWISALVKHNLLLQHIIVTFIAIYYQNVQLQVLLGLSIDMVLEEKLVHCLKYLPSVIENVPVVFVKLGCDGVLVAQRNAMSVKGYTATHYAPAPERCLPVSVVSVTGARRQVCTRLVIVHSLGSLWVDNGKCTR